MTTPYSTNLLFPTQLEEHYLYVVKLIHKKEINASKSELIRKNVLKFRKRQILRQSIECFEKYYNSLAYCSSKGRCSLEVSPVDGITEVAHQRHSFVTYLLSTKADLPVALSSESDDEMCHIILLLDFDPKVHYYL